MNPSGHRPTGTSLRVAICLVLALGTAALYWRVIHFNFINVDDPRFVIENEHVHAGLNWTSIVWAFRSFYVETWQPTTWLTHMLDWQLYGLNAGGHHLTNLLFHIANTLLLFLWLEQATKATARSAVVAGLFAWHPLHVESVAWICERKDVLSAFFWMLALLTYTRYAQGPPKVSDLPGPENRPLASAPNRGRWFFFASALFFFACALMSKPMAVTLPCVLLLLDVWPLGRISKFGPSMAMLRLIAEKIPFFILAMAMSAITVYAEKIGGTMGSLAAFPWSVRVAHTLAGYFDYLSEMFWPCNLAFFYPYSFHLSPTVVYGGAFLLATWTVLFLLRMRSQPSLLIGWLWFVGTLVPTIGLIQFALQSHADRYTYLPGIGLFMVVVWGVGDLFKRWPSGRFCLPILSGLALAGCLVVASRQLSYWQDSATLARHAIEVTENNYVAFDSLGRALSQKGANDEALACYVEAVRIDPNFPQAQFNLAVALRQRGDLSGALEHFTAAARVLPDHGNIHAALGSTLLQIGDGHLAAAIQEFTTALRLGPPDAAVHRELGIAFVRQGNLTNALSQFAEAVRLNPDSADDRFYFGLCLLDNHQPAAAAEQFTAELKLAPNETRAHFRLAQALQQEGKPAEAKAHYQTALRLTPDFPEAKAALDALQATHPEP